MDLNAAPVPEGQLDANAVPANNSQGNEAPQMDNARGLVSNVDLLPFSMAGILARLAVQDDPLDYSALIPIPQPVQPLMIAQIAQPAPLVAAAPLFQLPPLILAVQPVQLDQPVQPAMELAPPAQPVQPDQQDQPSPPTQMPSGTEPSPLSPTSPPNLEPTATPAPAAPAPVTKLPKRKNFLDVMKRKQGVTMESSTLGDICNLQVSKIALVPLEMAGFQDSYIVLKANGKLAVSSITQESDTGMVHIEGWTLAELKAAFGISGAWREYRKSGQLKRKRRYESQNHESVKKTPFKHRYRIKLKSVKQEMTNGRDGSEEIDVVTMDVEEESSVAAQYGMYSHVASAPTTHHSIFPSFQINFMNHNLRQCSMEYKGIGLAYIEHAPTPPAFDDLMYDEIYEEPVPSPQSPLPPLQSETFDQLMAPIFDHLIPEEDDEQTMN